MSSRPAVIALLVLSACARDSMGTSDPITRLAALPKLIEVVSGNAQRGLTGRALADSIVVRALTPSGAPAVGIGPGGEEAVLQPVEVAGGLKMIALPLDDSRALVIEVRSALGTDVNLCAQGVLIYEVDAAAPSGVGPVRVRGSRLTTSGPLFTKCGPWADATYGIGPGAISSFSDAKSGISVQVVAAEAGGAYRVRVKR